MAKLRNILPLLCAGVALGLLVMVMTRPAGAVSADAGPGAGLMLVKTVSTDGSCGVTDVITITWSANLTYCYTATNSGNVTLTTHTLTDTVLVSILDEFPYDLAPQATWAVTATFDPPNVPGPLENCALWTAQNNAGDSVQAGDCATVYILAPTAVSLSGFEGFGRVGGFVIRMGLISGLLLGYGICKRIRKIAVR